MELAGAGDFLFRGEVVLAYIISQEPESDRHKRPLHRGSVDYMAAGFEHPPYFPAGPILVFRLEVLKDADE